MKKRLLVGLLFAIVIQAQAQGGGYMTARLHSGFSMPQSPEAYSRLYDAGPNLGLSIGYALPAGIEFALSGTYSALNLDEDEFAASLRPGEEITLDLSPGDAFIWGASIEARVYRPRQRWAPYLFGGGGMRLFKRKDITVEVDGGSQLILGERHAGTALFLGLGFVVGITDHVGLFSEAGYERILSGDVKRATIPVKIGMIAQLWAAY